MYPTGVWSFQVKAAIRRMGREYAFSWSSNRDQFGQPVADSLPQVTVKGIYHEDVRWTQSLVSEEQSSNVNRNPTEAYILVEKSEFYSLPVEHLWGSIVQVQDKNYRLIKARDIEGLGLFCDLVLQEIEPNGLVEDRPHGLPD